MLSQIQKLAREGLFYIFGSSVLSQMCALLSSLVVIRTLPKVDYGYYVSANNIYSYLIAFVGLGLTSAVLQFCSERIGPERKSAIYRYSLVYGSLGNVVLSSAIIILAFLKESCGDYQVAFYLRLMAGLPFAVYINTFLQTVLRVELKNKEFSAANILYSLFSLAGNILFTLLLGVSGLIVSLYLANLVAAAKCMFSLKSSCFLGQGNERESRLTVEERKDITKYALICALTNFSSGILVLLDITCLDLVLGSSEVLADYRVASTIPAACAFLPSCMMTFFYPKLVWAFSTSKKSGCVLVKKLSKVFWVVNGIVFCVLVVCAPVIVPIVFGDKYSNTVLIFEILCLNYLLNSQRYLLGNVLAVIKHVKVNLALSILAGLINIVLNLILIWQLASLGAALSSVATTIVAGTLSWIYLFRFFRFNQEESISG